jgi:hypothetical protein
LLKLVNLFNIEHCGALPKRREGEAEVNVCLLHRFEQALRLRDLGFVFCRFGGHPGPSTAASGSQ